MRTVAALCRELLPDRRTDGALLAAFLSERNEATFLELVRRHGPLVWGVCRRTLPDPADAEDAFQATFLVLVSQANKLSARETLGPWLHRVAVWTARNVRRKNARRLARQRELPDPPASAPDSDLKADIDGALLSLPARYREPIILCHLQGFSRREAAERLGCPEGTLSSWLDRGLAKLRVRLRALDPAPALAVAAVAVPAILTANTARAAVASGVAASAVPPTVSSLVEGVLHMLWIKKATAATFALCAVFAVGVGMGLGTRPGQTGAVAQDEPKKPGGAQPKGAPPAAPDRAKEIEDAELEVMKLKTQQLFNEARLQDAKDKLAKLKADKADKPAPARQPLGDKDATLLKLDELKAQLAKIEAERAQLRAEVAKAQRGLDVTEKKLRIAAEQLAAQIERLERPDVKLGDRGPWYTDLCVGGKKVGVPFEVKEQDRGGGPVGSAKIDSEEMLNRHMARLKNDPFAPPALRIVVWEDAPNDRIKAALRACHAAGFYEAVIVGKIPTNDPDITFTPPNNDPGGKRDGWFEADELRVRLGDLLKPAKK